MIRFIFIICCFLLAFGQKSYTQELGSDSIIKLPITETTLFRVKKLKKYSKGNIKELNLLILSKNGGMINSAIIMRGVEPVLPVQIFYDTTSFVVKDMLFSNGKNNCRNKDLVIKFKGYSDKFKLIFDRNKIFFKQF